VCVLLPGVAAAGSIWRSSSDAIYSRHRTPNDLTTTACRHADSTDADSESGERATPCSLLALFRTPHTPCLEDAGARVDRGTLASRIFPFVSRVAPRPPPPPRLL